MSSYTRQMNKDRVYMRGEKNYQCRLLRQIQCGCEIHLIFPVVLGLKLGSFSICSFVFIAQIGLRSIMAMSLSLSIRVALVETVEVP